MKFHRTFALSILINTKILNMQRTVNVDEIKIHPFFRNKLKDEFACSYQTVINSLRYISSTERNFKIRKRAKEMLQAEADKVRDFK